MKAETKTGFKYGLILGLVMGGMIGFFIAHWLTWVFVGAAVGILITVWRLRRPKLAAPRAAGQ